MDIYKIEAEIQQILTTDKKSWIRVYELISYVENDKAWRDNFPSFSSWIRHLASISKVHESVIWQRKKAGEIYKRYQRRGEESGRNPVPFAQVRVSPANLILAEKVGQGITSTTDNLIDKVLDGELKRSELMAAWQSVKRVREANGESPMATSRHEKIKPDEVAIAASDVSIALTHSNWLYGFSDIHNSVSNIHGKRIYRAVPEFPVFTGSTRRSKRMDLLIVENYTLNKAFHLNTHAIEIKASKSDMINDHKMSEYAEFVDFMWIATTANLKDDASDYALSEWGIIVVGEDGDAHVVRKARRLNPSVERRCDLMQSYVIREG